MRSRLSFLLCLLLVSYASNAVITGACEKDSQCGGGMCCAISLWIRSLRMCVPMGQEGEECHPMSHKVPFYGRDSIIHAHVCPTWLASPQMMENLNVSLPFCFKITSDVKCASKVYY
ncbi:prokineticin-2 [Triplophysa dalaica]|uniref:prokineticin-2 n=1 Tax=Triplophysa dalaica TaxID=1582913 RepID=UPI0024E02DCD|nr:prokineticin-2 [Triplophysa dalaica]